MQNHYHAGTLVAEVLAAQGVRFLYTRCGGPISPILIGAAQQGIRVVDVRHEATAVFAADATARLTGVPGVAAVTAGPGLTNTLTAVKNAQRAQSPLVLLGGATATLLQGRGALQEMDQLALMQPHVKAAWPLRRVRDVVPALEAAFRVAQEGVPGPVFVELPVDLLYPEAVVRERVAGAVGKAGGMTTRLTEIYLNWHVSRTFAGAWRRRAGKAQPVAPLPPSGRAIRQVRRALQRAERPLLLVGSQALAVPTQAEALRQAVLALGIPTYLSGMARGLLGHDPLHQPHQRTQALHEADLLILAGLPFDFRLGYGHPVPSRTPVIAVNRSHEELYLNRAPTLGVQADAGAFLIELAARGAPPADRWQSWRERLDNRNQGRAAEIGAAASAPTPYVNPVWLCQQLAEAVGENSVIVGDGGDFVATASSIVRPRQPLRWLDPGPFGTLGVGGGFALASKLVYPHAEVWLLYGDGAAGYSLAEFDTFARHGLPVIAVVGNNGSWAQIAREQVALFGTPLGTELARTAYHEVARGFGGHGLLVERPEKVAPALEEAKRCAGAGFPVCVNVQLGQSDFQQGSISI